VDEWVGAVSKSHWGAADANDGGAEGSIGGDSGGQGRSTRGGWGGLECRAGKGGGIVSPRTVELVGNAHSGSAGHVSSDEGIGKLMIDGVDIAHHAGGSVEDGKMVAKELLGPAHDHRDVATVFEDFADGRAITESIEHGAP
jgi:hypothetical protein